MMEDIADCTNGKVKYRLLRLNQVAYTHEGLPDMARFALGPPLFTANTGISSLDCSSHSQFNIVPIFHSNIFV